MSESYTELATNKATEMMAIAKAKGADAAIVGKAKAMEMKSKAVDTACVVKVKTIEVAFDRTVQVSTASAAGGAVVCGAGGGVLGMLLGGVAGGVVGIVPAIFTFGLSIPFFATVGAGLGLATGAAVGGATGAVGGGAVGYGAYKKRDDIGALFGKVLAKAKSTKESVCSTVSANTSRVKKLVLDKAAKAKELAMSCYTSVTSKALEAAKITKTKSVEIASDKGVQVGVASAVGGSVVVGSAGAATGCATGAIVGGAVGLVPALFTFGLSIPIGAFLGGGCGLAAGAAVGSTAGFVGGGAAGYGVYTKRSEISSVAKGTMAKAKEGAEYVKVKASASAAHVKSRMVVATGGTD